MKSDWEPPVQPSLALETFLEEVKLELASIEFDKPKDKYIYGRAPSSQRVIAVSYTHLTLPTSDLV